MKRYKDFLSENIDITGFTDFDKFRHSIVTSPSYKDCDLLSGYIVNTFEENEDGSITKFYEPITAVLKITPDRESYSNLQGMKMRGKAQDSDRKGTMVYQWVDKDIADDMLDEIQKDWKSDDGQFYLKTLVDHFKAQLKKK